VEESLQRLAVLDIKGPCAEAFTFKQRFDPVSNEVKL
jgi:hypothetical protein